MNELNNVQQQSNRLAKQNDGVLRLYYITAALLVIGYIGEFIKGTRSAGYVFGFVGFVVLAAVISIVMFLRDKNSEIVKWVMLFSFLTFYTFIIITSQKPITFFYFLPFGISYLLYFNRKIIRTVCVGVVFVNLLSVVVNYTVMGLSASNYVTDYTIQVLGIILYAISLLIVSSRLIKFNQDDVDSISNQRDMETKMLSTMKEVSSDVKSETDDLNNHFTDIEHAFKQLNNSAIDISNGAGEVAKLVEEELTLSNEITQELDQAKNLSDDVIEVTEAVYKEVTQGKMDIVALEEKSQKVKESNELLIGQMDKLENKMVDVEGIMTMLIGITEQTNLLALNAAIESARAGELGKGFAVVAEEVRKLANQSKQSVEEVTKEIHGLRDVVKGVVEETKSLSEVNSEQNQLINSSSQAFERIDTEFNKVNDKIESMNEKVNAVYDSNTKMIDKINEISGISEEFASVSESVSEHTNENIVIVDNATQSMLSLHESVQKLDQA